ncbi:MAG: ABC transporter permease [Alphaproteobacteria bacterium]
MTPDFGAITNHLDRYLDGVLMTMELTAISVAAGLALAVPLALMRVSRKPAVWMPVYGYVYFFRGTPLLVQIFLIYYGSGQFRSWFESAGLWTLFREPYFCALLSLTLNTAAYTTEILRGSIQAVPFGEIEAARALGMSRWLLIRRIVLPKAFRFALPAYTNEVVFLFQATSLVSIITLMDLFGVARVLISRTFASFEILIFVGVIYCAISYAMLYGFRWIEHRWSGHLRAMPGIAAKGVVAAPVAQPIVR